jgi:hypothetical protein
MATPTGPSKLTADEALVRLGAGNERFLRGEVRTGRLQRESLAAGIWNATPCPVD